MLLKPTNRFDNESKKVAVAGSHGENGRKWNSWIDSVEDAGIQEKERETEKKTERDCAGGPGG